MVGPMIPGAVGLYHLPMDNCAQWQWWQRICTQWKQRQQNCSSGSGGSGIACSGSGSNGIACSVGSDNLIVLAATEHGSVKVVAPELCIVEAEAMEWWIKSCWQIISNQPVAVALTTAFNWWKQHQQSAVEMAGSTVSSTVTATAKLLYILQSTIGDGDSISTSNDSGCNSKIIKNQYATINWWWQKQQQPCVGNSTVSGEGDYNSNNNNQQWQKQQQQLLAKQRQQSTGSDKNSNNNQQWQKLQYLTNGNKTATAAGCKKAATTNLLQQKQQQQAVTATATSSDDDKICI